MVHSIKYCPCCGEELDHIKEFKLIDHSDEGYDGLVSFYLCNNCNLNFELHNYDRDKITTIFV